MIEYSIHAVRAVVAAWKKAKERADLGLVETCRHTSNSDIEVPALVLSAGICADDYRDFIVSGVSDDDCSNNRETKKKEYLSALDLVLESQDARSSLEDCLQEQAQTREILMENKAELLTAAREAYEKAVVEFEASSAAEAVASMNYCKAQTRADIEAAREAFEKALNAHHASAIACLLALELAQEVENDKA